MIDLVPIAKTEVDWTTLLPSAAKVLGRSVSASLDEANWAVSGLEAFVACAAEFSKRGTHPNKGTRDPKALAHASVTFLVAAPQDCFFFLQTNVAVSKSGNFAIVSGSFAQWRAACAQGLAKDAEGDLKLLLCSVVSWFEKLGWGTAFGGFEKMHTKDGLYYLEPKR